jgi:hypothetical protein
MQVLIPVQSESDRNRTACRVGLPRGREMAPLVSLGGGFGERRKGIKNGLREALFHDSAFDQTAAVQVNVSRVVVSRSRS